MLWYKQFFECRVATNTSVNSYKIRSFIDSYFHCILLTKKTSFIVIQVTSAQCCHIICNNTRLYWLIKVI